MKYLLLLTLTFLLIRCGEKDSSAEKIIVNGFAQGTTYSVTYISEDGFNYQRAIDSTLIEIDNSLSTYQKKSLISKFNQADSMAEIDLLFEAVYNISGKIFKETNGAFDPTIAPVVNAWGFGFENLKSTEKRAIDSLLNFVGFDKTRIVNSKAFKTKKGIMLDFNAVAQGYTVDVLGDLLEKRGIKNYLVEVGGELKASGVNMNDTLWRVGIDRPLPDLKERELEAIVHLDNKALATSGNYRKFYEKNGVKYAHTINPKTGYPVLHNLLSSTVIARNCAEADAYATAFMVLGLQESKFFLNQHKELGALLIYSDERGDLQSFITGNLKKYVALNLDEN